MHPIVTYVIGGITLITFIGLCVVYLRGSADKGTIESQKRLIESRGVEIGDLTRRLGESDNKVESLTTRVTTLEGENNVLRSAVGHTEEIRILQATTDALQGTIEEHHNQSLDAWNRMIVAIEGIQR